ncbi:citrate/2-methylcitrate synthase [Asticcacaulis sp. BYS171W]|uniref:citrate synthase (unknown stereospecificity) n=1 Tax=Asticcacaulis aquaticus TaxID=2984212 RepID=A0ABT5HRS5_9CAUL|nr:citrate/2-methylcitrate synthase [Asticcacaulis aquaticus]MDC7682772.1 citrate/2-methylcitrate synthase [Asticcacaulis aquaticus]
MSRQWISRAEALERLDVKPQTLYAYVSRQRIAARADPTHPRKSLYALDDIERLSTRAPGRQTGVPAPKPVLTGGPSVRGEAAIDSEIFVAIDDRPYYRTHDSLALSETENFEAVAALLWADEPNPFGALKPRPDVNFPGSPRARVLGMLSRRLEEEAMAEPIPDRNLKGEAAGVLNELIDAVTNGGPRLFFHQRLARAWKVNDPKDVDLIRRALVLSADNGLDQATLAARAAAAGQGPLAAPVMAGFATLSGPALGGRVSRAESFVTQVRRQGNPRLVAETFLRQGIELPGFETGQSACDALRAESLMKAAPHIGEDLKTIRAVGEDLTGKPLGFTLALALIGRHLDLPKEAPFTLFGVGRSAGWLAHAIEQTESKSRPNIRLRYIGENPVVNA